MFFLVCVQFSVNAFPNFPAHSISATVLAIPRTDRARSRAFVLSPKTGAVLRMGLFTGELLENAKGGKKEKRK